MTLRRCCRFAGFVQAVVLAGGLGTRLWPLTLGMPKPLLPVMGRPLLAHLLDRLPTGVRQVLLAVSFESSKVQKWADEGDDPALKGRSLRVVREDPPLGTGGALANLADTAGLGAGGEPVLVLNGDLVSDMDLEGLVAQHRSNPALATIALVEVEDPSRFGVVELGDDWRILRFVEKPARHVAPSNWVNAGAYVLDPGVLNRIRRGRPVSLEREVFPALASMEPGMRGRPHAGLWVDCGTRHSYLEAHRGLMARGPLDAHDPRHPGSFVAKGARVAPDASVQGSVVMADAVVGAKARVSDSILAAGAVIGAGAVIERCVVGEGARVREGARVMDSRIVGESS